MSEKILSEISKNYAKALIESTAGISGDDILKQLEAIEDTISSSADLRIVMSNSSISSGKKIEIIEEIFSKKIDQKLLNLLKILIDKNRFNELPSICDYYKQMTEKKENKRTVEIVSPIELNFENKTKIMFKLEKKLNSEIIPIWTVDESLIAGLVFKFDDYVIDTSVKAKLEDLSKTLNRG